MATNSLGAFSAFFTVPGGVLGGHDVNAVDISDPNVAAGDIFTQTASGTTSTTTQGMLPF